MRTRQQAIAEAKRRAAAAGTVRFVLHVPWDEVYGPWAVANDEQIDTFYMGISERAIVAEVHSDGSVHQD